MLGTDFILDALAKEKIDHLFMVPGGLIDPFLPALGRQSYIKPIVAAKESGAAYMADGYARASQKFGAALCIGGPGLGNAITAIETAQSDGSPILVMSGEVATSYEGYGMFQDASSQTLNDVSTVKQITHYSSSIDNPKNLHHLLQSAMIHMQALPKGPVHLSIPKDSQVAVLDAVYEAIPQDISHAKILSRDSAVKSLEHFTAKIPKTLENPESSESPEKDVHNVAHIVMLIGSGISNEKAAQDLIFFSERFTIPVATTLRAKGIFPEDHPNSLGVFGYAGSHHAKVALLDNPPDLLLVLGSGLNERDTMHWALKLNPKKTINVNISPFALVNQLCGSVIIGDAGTYLHFLITEIDKIAADLDATKELRSTLLKSIASKPRLQDIENTTSSAKPIHPARIISELRKAMPRETILVVDSGAHRAFSGHYWTAYKPFTYISATNLDPWVGQYLPLLE